MREKWEWINEAENFRDEFIRSTGRKPELEDVIAECNDMATDKELRDSMLAECSSVKEFAETLYTYMYE